MINSMVMDIFFSFPSLQFTPDRDHPVSKAYQESEESKGLPDLPENPERMDNPVWKVKR